MPSIIKRKTSHVEASGFAIYAGDDPRPGGYRAIIKVANVVKSSGDNLMYNLTVELKAKDGSDKSKYDGWAGFPRIVMTENETNLQKEQAFYQAVCGKADADVKTDVDPSKFKKADGQKAKVLSIGGVNPIGKVVNVQLRMSAASDDYPSRLEVDMIFRARDEDGAVEDVTTDDIEDDEDSEEAEDGLPLYEEDDLNGKSLIALRKILVEEFEQDSAEMKVIKAKKALVDLILELQESLEDDEEEPDDDEEEEEDEEDDEEEEEDDDRESEIDAELAEMDRAALKKSLTKRESPFKVLKSTTDDALRAELKTLMLADPPF